jgi:5-methylcytosine-specific restriction protein A
MMIDTRLRGRRAVERRARQLREFPLCVRCEQESRVVLATVADHVIALVNGGRDDGPLQSLCGEHHRLKTAEDLSRIVKRRYGCDIHGHSLDPDHPRNKR